MLVSPGEAPLGIVYQTDAAAEPAVRIVGAFPEISHPPIIYPVGAARGLAEPRCRRPSSSFVQSAKAKDVFEKQGFTRACAGMSN